MSYFNDVNRIIGVLADEINYKPYLFVFWGLVEIAAITACLIVYTSIFKAFPWYTSDSDMMLLLIIAIGI